MEDSFNKLEFKEILRLLKAANDAVDPSVDMLSWNFMSHFEICSQDIYNNIISDESPMIKE